MAKKPKPKILCVDDEPLNLKLFTSMLEPLGYEVIQVSSGKKALEAVTKERIDLILLDILMPKIDGYEVCKTIKNDKNYHSIPVIMVTSLDSKTDRIKAIEVGAEDFISKPLDKSEVLARVKMLLKMKNLHDKVNKGYTNISSLTSFGNELLGNFNAMSFNFISTIDKIVNQVIRFRPDRFEKPQVVVVGIMHKGKKWQWHHYESSFNELIRTPIETKLEETIQLPSPGNFKTHFYNENEITKAPIQPLLKKLTTKFTYSYTNCVSYISNKFCIFALNYGGDVSEYEASVLNSLVMQSLFLKSLSEQIKKTEDLLVYTIQSLVRASELNDKDSGNHVIRIGEYCAILAEELGLPQEFVKSIRLQARMHDVGMVSIPARILQKTEKLNFEEWGIIRKHTIYGAQILGDNPNLKLARDIALSHHEKWDGSGYPNWLKGAKIPIEGRITCIADHYDTLRIARLYKSAFDHKKAYDIITKGDERSKPSHFDPKILQAFKKRARQMEEIFETLKD